jgi:hypothetical protein
MADAEIVIFYDGRPVPTVSIMEFRDGPLPPVSP